MVQDGEYSDKIYIYIVFILLFHTVSSHIDLPGSIKCLYFFFLFGFNKSTNNNNKKRNVVHSLGPCLSGFSEVLMAHSISDRFGLSPACDLGSRGAFVFP